MLYEFNRDSTAALETQNICAAYGDEDVDTSSCYRLFAKFQSGDTTLVDKSRLEEDHWSPMAKCGMYFAPCKSMSNNSGISHTTQLLSADSKSWSSCSRQGQ